MTLSSAFGRLSQWMRSRHEQPSPSKLTDPGRSVEPMLHRSYDALRPEMGVSPGETCDDAVMVRRVLQAYMVSNETEAIKPSALWAMIFDSWVKTPLDFAENH